LFGIGVGDEVHLRIPKKEEKKKKERNMGRASTLSEKQG